jgi:hypothetical protein
VEAERREPFLGKPFFYREMHLQNSKG